MSLALGTLQTVTSVLATDTHIHTLPLILVCSLSRHFARFMVGGYQRPRGAVDKGQSLGWIYPGAMHAVWAARGGKRSRQRSQGPTRQLLAGSEA